MNNAGRAAIAKTPLVLLRPGLTPYVERQLLGHLTITAEISTFAIEILSRWESYALVIVDGHCLRLNDWKSVRLNLLRALMIRNSNTQFVLFHDVELTRFDPQTRNLLVVHRKLEIKTVNEEFWELLASQAGFWLKAHSAS